MSKLTFIHEDSDFARTWKLLGTEDFNSLFHERKVIPLRFFIPHHQPDVDVWGFPKQRDLGRETVLSGMRYHDLIMNPGMALKASIGLNNKINFESVDINAYHGSLKRYYEIDEVTQWRPLWTYPTIKLEKYISKLLNTEKAFDADFIKFSQWLKDRLKFKRMDRYDLSRNNFYSASRRYGQTFAHKIFTTY